MSLIPMTRSEEEMLQDIKNNPDKHRHDFEGLTDCCMVDGIIILSLMDAHEKDVDLGSNGGRRCDVSEGPCSCGDRH